MGAIGLAACDAAPPPNAADSRPVESETISEGETLVDVVRRTLAEVIRDPDPYSRARRLGALLPTLVPETVPAVKRILDDRMLDLRASEIELLLRFWATHEPAEASHWAKVRSRLGYREVAVYAALSTWAVSDPRVAAGATWPWAVESTSLERIVPIALVRGWYEAGGGDSGELTQYIGNLPIGILRQRAIAAYVRVVIEYDGAETVMRWAESLPDDDETFKLSVFRRVVDALSLLDLDAGLRWCDAHCNGPYGNNMRSLIARNWVLQDGPAALAWLSGGPEGHDKDLAVRLTFGLWADRDRAAAFRWMEEQTAGEPAPWLQPTYPVYARLLSGEDPAAAIGWAGRIENDATRENMLVRVARVWRHLDEAAAEEWLLQSPLSEEAREKVRSPAPGRAQPNPER